MRKLTPEQARWLIQVMESKIFDPDMHTGVSVYELVEEAIDELTAKPPSKEFCQTPPRCFWWFVKRWFRDTGGKPVPMLECTHPDFTPGTCPIGRWEEK